MKFLNKALLLVFISTAFLAGCDKDDDENEMSKMFFTFSHNIDGAPLDVDTIKFSNAAGNQYSVTTLKYFVSDFRLHRTDGSSVLIDAEHYIDARENSTLNFDPVVEIESGSYSHISFIFGIDSIKNITGRYSNPPESNMEWPVPMGGGYHYMKLEGKYDSAGVIKNYNTHMGPTMGNQNYVEVTLLASAFTADGNDVAINIGMNINNWYVNPNTYDFNVFGSAIMGNQSAQQQLKENGADVFSVISIE